MQQADAAESTVSNGKLTDIKEQLKAHVGKLDVKITKDGIVTGLGPEVDSYINASPKLVEDLTKFVTTDAGKAKRHGVIELFDDNKQQTNYSRKANLISINVGENGIRPFAETFVLGLAHELGHYQFQFDPLAEFRTSGLYDDKSPTGVVGFEEWQKHYVAESVRMGANTEAAATINEVRVADDIMKSLGVDISAAHRGTGYTFYREQYDKYLANPTRKGYEATLAAIGKHFGAVEYPNDPSRPGGKSDRTYQQTWRASGRESAITSWHAPNGAYAAWDALVKRQERTVNSMLESQKKELVGSPKWTQLEGWLKGTNGEPGELQLLEIYTKKRGK